MRTALERQGLARNALTGQAACLRIVALRDPRAVPIRTTAIAAEDQFALVPRDEPAARIPVSRDSALFPEFADMSA